VQQRAAMVELTVADIGEWNLRVDAMKWTVSTPLRSSCAVVALKTGDGSVLRGRLGAIDDDHLARTIFRAQP
jgi:hypothetical protein